MAGFDESIFYEVLTYSVSSVYLEFSDQQCPQLDPYNSNVVNLEYK